MNDSLCRLDDLEIIKHSLCDLVDMGIIPSLCDLDDVESMNDRLCILDDRGIITTVFVTVMTWEL